jgi:hypothetical protein
MRATFPVHFRLFDFIILILFEQITSAGVQSLNAHLTTFLLAEPFGPVLLIRTPDFGRNTTETCFVGLTIIAVIAKFWVKLPTY